MSLFAGFYIVSLLAGCQLVGLIFVARAINRLCDEVATSRTVTVAISSDPGATIKVDPRIIPAGAE